MAFWPDVIHCNDWQTALIPIYLKDDGVREERFRSIRTVMTIHNIEYQGRYGPEVMVLQQVLNALKTGFRDGVDYEDLYRRLLFGDRGAPADEYLLLADFTAYCDAEKRMAATYADAAKWNAMSLHNIARSGVFAADRAVAEYADKIWHAKACFSRRGGKIQRAEEL